MSRSSRHPLRLSGHHLSPTTHHPSPRILRLPLSKATVAFHAASRVQQTRASSGEEIASFCSQRHFLSNLTSILPFKERGSSNGLCPFDQTPLWIATRQTGYNRQECRIKDHIFPKSTLLPSRPTSPSSKGATSRTISITDDKPSSTRVPAATMSDSRMSVAAMHEALRRIVAALQDFRPASASETMEALSLAHGILIAQQRIARIARIARMRREVQQRGRRTRRARRQNRWIDREIHRAVREI